MEGWVPDNRWAEQDAYIIGGGPSLKTFPWDVLRGRNTIGCNSAYLLGPEICNVLFFGDRCFFERYRDVLSQLSCDVITNCSNLQAHQLPWLKVMKRQARGLATGGTLGWNMNSGAAALNLALSFGACRVFLLGFDMMGERNNHNWHGRNPANWRGTVYARFQEGFRQVAASLPKVFPGREVICVHDEKRLAMFPTVTLEEHFGSTIHGGHLVSQTA